MDRMTVNGVELAFRVYNSDAPRGWVVLLNGVMASYSSWSDLADRHRTAGYGLLLHDFRGQLLSEKPPGPYKFSDHSADLAALMEALAIPRAHLVGTSYGGEVALQFSLDYPGKAESLTVIDSVSEVGPLLEAAVDGWIAAAETGDLGRFYRIMLPTIYGEEFIRHNRQFLKQRGEQVENLPSDYLTGQISLYRTFLTLDITEHLKEIALPCLVICGAEDTLKPPRYSRIIAEEIPDAELFIIPRCGHVTIFEKPEEVGTLVLGFLVGRFG